MKELIIAAVVDTTRLTLYRPNGSTIVLIQGDERIAGILSPANTAAWSQGRAVEIELLPERDNHLAQFEKKSGFKLFRVLKDKVKTLFASPEPLEPAVYGDPLASTKASKMLTAIDEIMANAESVTAPGYQVAQTTEQDTIVAVTPNGQLVPGVEALESHMAHAVQNDRTAGVQAFIARLGQIITERNFMVAELLNFCRRGDLQFTDDGAILAYKILKTIRGLPADTFVDCASGKVQQKVGSVVCMDRSLVDDSRRTQCSSGLHIARRGYLRSFAGNICTLVKIEPEDVVAVPAGEPDKMRVRAYHILGVINEADTKLLRSGNPVASAETRQMLGQAMVGKHIAKLEEVKITGAYGEGVQIRNLLGGLVAVPKITAAPVTPVSQIPDPTEIKTDAPVIAPKAVNQAVKAAKAAASKPAQPAKKAADTSSQAARKNLPTANLESDLSANQKEALRLAREGVLSMREIGRRCNISDRAAARLLDKFGRKSA